MKFKISVIVPIYNKEKLLRDCLQSVFAQTLKEIEVICIDDGSTDSSLSILHEFQTQYDNMVVVRQRNAGAGTSRNRGIRMAQGQYLVFLDADDYYPSVDVLESLHNGVTQNNVVICGGSFSREVDKEVTDKYSGRNKGYTFERDEIVDYRQFQFPYGFTRYIYETNFLRRENLSFPSYSIGEDTLFLVRALIAAGQFYSLKKVVYCYRKNMNFENLSKPRMEDLIKALTEVLSLSRKYGLAKLHLDIIESLHYGYYYTMICRLAANHREEFLILLQRLNKEIDMNLLPFKSEREVYLEPDELIGLMESLNERKKMFIETVQRYRKVIIYGAGMTAHKVFDFLRAIPEVEVLFFAVTDSKGDLSSISGIKVKSIDDMLQYKKDDILIIVATMERYHQEIRNKLELLQFKHITEVTTQELMFM